MGLIHKYSGYRIPSQNLSAEIRGMKTDMAVVKNADWLISGSSVPLSGEQRKLLWNRISVVEDKIKDAKRNVFIWGTIAMLALILYTKEAVLFIFPVIVVLLILSYFDTVKTNNNLVRAYEHNSYRAYPGTITNKKWGKTYGDAEDFYFFLVINGVNVRVEKEFYENCSVDDRIMSVILNWENKDYLVLLQCRESNIYY